MLPSFDAVWSAHQADLDAAFSETFVLEPQALPQAPGGSAVVDVNARTVASSARAILPFVGTFVDAGALLHAHGRVAADSRTHAVASEKPMIDVAQSAMPQRPQVGDRVRRLATGEVFLVTTYLPEAPVRAWIFLADALSRPEQPR